MMGSSTHWKCAQCAEVNTSASLFCTKCGATLSEEHVESVLAYASGLNSLAPIKMQTPPISLTEIETETNSADDIWSGGSGGMQQQQQQKYEKVSTRRVIKPGLLSRRELFIGLGGFVVAGGLVLGYNSLRTAPLQSTHRSLLPIPTPLGVDNHLAPAENFSAAWSAEGRYLACASEAGTLLIKDDLANNTLVNDTTNAINDLIWSPINVSNLALACDDATVQIRQMPANTITQIYSEHTNPVLAISWTQDGKYIASVDEGPVVKIWDAATLETLVSYSNIFNGQVTSLAWSPDGKLLACGGADSTVLVLDIPKNHLLLTYTHHEQAVEAVSWSPDGRYIASTSDDATVQVWQPHRNKPVVRYTGHTDKVWCLDWSPNSQFLASGSWDKTVRIWQLGESKPYRIFTQHADRVVALDWSKTGRIVSIDASGNILLWSLNS